MSDLRPPSLRDTKSLTDVVRHHSLLLEKLGGGLLGGRSRIPDPLGLTDDAAADSDPGGDGDMEEPEWWDEDRHTVVGSGTVTWLLTHAPLPESLFIRWNGLPQTQPEDWTLGDDGQTVTIPDPDGILQAGDVFSAQYQYLDIIADPPPPPPPTMEFIGSTVTENFTSASLALPAGTQQGDFIFVACGTGLLTGNQPACDDSRMLIVRNDGFGTGHHLVCFGIEDGSGDPVLVEVSDPEGNGSILLATYRCTGYVSTVSLGGSGDAVLGSVPGDDPQIGILCISAGGTAPADPYEGWSQDALGQGSGTFQAMLHNDGTTGFGLAGTGLWALISVGLMPGSGIAGI